MREEKIIMYDSPEAGRKVTAEVWEINSPNGASYTPNEHLARWNNCTHIKCECGKIRRKHYTLCDECRNKNRVERFNALPFREWDLQEPVCTWDGDTYFFTIDDLEEFMFNNEQYEIDLIICEPVSYSEIDFDYWGNHAHEDWEPPKRLIEKVSELNNFIKTLPPHSWAPGKIRTSYYSKDVKTELTDK